MTAISVFDKNVLRRARQVIEQYCIQLCTMQFQNARQAKTIENQDDRMSMQTMCPVNKSLDEL